MAASAFQINVRKVGKKFVLFNGDEVAGGRLFKGDHEKKPVVIWPFYGKIDWMRHDNKADAEKAAEKLQTYLLKRDRQLNADHYPTS